MCLGTKKITIIMLKVLKLFRIVFNRLSCHESIYDWANSEAGKVCGVKIIKRHAVK